MNKYLLLILVLLQLVKLPCAAEERFVVHIDPLKVDEEDGRETYLISLPSLGYKRMRVLISGVEGMKVFNGESRTGSFQSLVSFPSGAAVRYVVQVEQNDGTVARSEARLINARDEQHRVLIAQADELVHQIEVVSAKLQRQEQFLSQLDKLSDRERGLLKEGMQKRLGYDRSSRSAELQVTLQDAQRQIDTMLPVLDRLQANPATAKRALELRTKLEGYVSLLEALKNEAAL